MPRIMSRNWSRMFSSMQADVTPGPKISDDAALVVIAEDNSHLVAPLLNAAGVAGVVLTAPAVNRNFVRLEAPSTRHVRVSQIANLDGVQALIVQRNVALTVTVGPTLIANQFTWGPLQQHEAFSGETSTVVTSGLILLAGTEWQSDLSPIVLAPGETLEIVALAGATALNCRWTWEEVGD